MIASAVPVSDHELAPARRARIGHHGDGHHVTALFVLASVTVSVGTIVVAMRWPAVGRVAVPVVCGLAAAAGGFATRALALLQSHRLLLSRLSTWKRRSPGEDEIAAS